MNQKAFNPLIDATNYDTHPIKSREIASKTNENKNPTIVHQTHNLPTQQAQ